MAFQRDRPGAERQAVARIEDTWRIVDEWWRERLISRSYFRVLAEDGRTLTLFHDDTQELATGWYEQAY